MTDGGYTAFKDLKKLRFILRALAPLAPGRLLEIGCGSGNIAAAAARGGWKVTGIDVDVTSLGYARGRAAAQFAAGDAGALPLRGPFDAVVCSEVLEHLREPAAALAEVRRVLRPGGRLVVTVPNGYGPYELANRVLAGAGIREAVKRLVIVGAERERRRRESTYHPHTPHEQHFTLAVLRRRLGEAGFAVDRVGHSDFLSWVPYVRHVASIARADCAVADRLPSALVSGWYVDARAC